MRQRRSRMPASAVPASRHSSRHVRTCLGKGTNNWASRISSAREHQKLVGDRCYVSTWRTSRLVLACNALRPVTIFVPLTHAAHTRQVPIHQPAKPRVPALNSHIAPVRIIVFSGRLKQSRYESPELLEVLEAHDSFMQDTVLESIPGICLASW
ncbi:hypothetical protein OH76DRAFT_847544 [Lentinus brumalis]|uniref:Uncharacterized protein n=1 Tax=Lentinus brumalis TaxID=2498619 RepID=A0A371DQT5_9APHY|nr:hypothetical protein OH76DRAFT_847544 [Polyporus brumalis]